MTLQLAAAAMPAQVRFQNVFGDVNYDDDVGSEDDNCWSQEDDQITAQYQTIRKIKDRDTISQMSIESSDSSNQQPIFFQVRNNDNKHCKPAKFLLAAQKKRLKNDQC